MHETRASVPAMKTNSDATARLWPNWQFHENPPFSVRHFRREQRIHYNGGCRHNESWAWPKTHRKLKRSKEERDHRAAGAAVDSVESPPRLTEDKTFQENGTRNAE